MKDRIWVLVYAPQADVDTYWEATTRPPSIEERATARQVFYFDGDTWTTLKSN